ncbi:MAG: helix-turn-helix transcriptional regulator [Oscillospiraceae bacterium]|nr:helix-turn-helix transcriptional regulator [Oscillospiraceae bacterium]
MTIPEKIRKLRIEHGLTMKSCAESADIPYYTYQKYEYGEREISVSAIRKLATLYKVSTDYLLDGEIETPTQDLIEQLSDAQSEEEFLKKYFMLEPELRAKARKQMQKALKAQQESDDYIVQTTTIGAELDRRESEQAHALSETEVKKTAV